MLFWNENHGSHYPKIIVKLGILCQPFRVCLALSVPLIFAIYFPGPHLYPEVQFCVLFCGSSSLL